MKHVKLFEQFVNEGAKIPKDAPAELKALLGDFGEDGEIVKAYHDGGHIEVTTTQKTWGDGSPVIKYFDRTPKKEASIPKGEFYMMISKYSGLAYFKHRNVWYRTVGRVDRGGIFEY